MRVTPGAPGVHLCDEDVEEAPGATGSDQPAGGIGDAGGAVLVLIGRRAPFDGGGGGGGGGGRRGAVESGAEGEADAGLALGALQSELDLLQGTHAEIIEGGGGGGGGSGGGGGGRDRRQLEVEGCGVFQKADAGNGGGGGGGWRWGEVEVLDMAGRRIGLALWEVRFTGL